jgi:SHAQKYF class myb-like DNA-binding protein
MFVVTSVNALKTQKKQKKHLNKETNLDFFSPNIFESKQNVSNYDNSIQVNSSSDSTKGGFQTSFISEQNISEKIQEIQNKNEFIEKKHKYFQIINKENMHNLNEKKRVIKLKKIIKKINNNNILEENKIINEGRWNEEENLRFLEAIYNYGNNWKEVKRYICTRTINQVRSHAQKFMLKLKTFKDSTIGIDFTTKLINKLSDIVDVIKSSEKNNKNSNILLSLSQKLSDKNFKNGRNSRINEQNDRIKNNYLNTIESGESKDKYNTKEEKNNMNSENIKNKIINNQNITIKKEDKVEINNEKKKINDKIKNEKDKKENLEEDKKYFDYIDSSFLYDNKYIIIDGIAFENNKNITNLSHQNQYNNSKEIRTINIIKSNFYS